MALPIAVCEAQPKPPTTAAKLGYPADAKLLIIHADDVGLAHSVNQATFKALQGKSVTSASIMVPCPWFTEAAAWAKEHPDADLGLHLTLTSEWRQFRWGPVASKDKVRGLLDPDEYLWRAVAPVAERATPGEVEQEIRAQVQRAMQAGVRPTHLDTHMGTLIAKPAFYAAYVKVAREQRLPFMAMRMPTAPPETLALFRDDDPVLDAFAMAGEQVEPRRWMEYYAGVIRSLKPGLTLLIVHLGYDDAELRAITEGKPAYGSAWRQRDFDVVSSSEFKHLLEEDNVTLVGWKDLRAQRK